VFLVLGEQASGESRNMTIRKLLQLTARYCNLSFLRGTFAGICTLRYSRHESNLARYGCRLNERKLRIRFWESSRTELGRTIASTPRLSKYAH